MGQANGTSLAAADVTETTSLELAQWRPQDFRKEASQKSPGALLAKDFPNREDTPRTEVSALESMVSGYETQAN